MAEQLDAGRRRDMFEAMLLMRRFEESVALMSKDHPFGHFHLYIGQARGHLAPDR